MGDMTKQFQVTVTDPNGQRETVYVHAGSVGFSVSGDLIFEDETREFQECFAKGHWLNVQLVKESN